MALNKDGLEIGQPVNPDDLRRVANEHRQKEREEISKKEAKEVKEATAKESASDSKGNARTAVRKASKNKTEA